MRKQKIVNMKILITESQKHLLWLMRRIEDDEYLDYIWRYVHSVK